MTTYETIKKLCDEKNIAVTALEKELGFGRGSIGKLRNSSTSAERLQKIADYFHVTVNDLMNNTDNAHSLKTDLTSKDEKDIKKDLDNIMKKISSGADGSASYDGEPLSPESLELFRGELEIALQRLKLINKEKYNPLKNKK
ncbi:helix-turn-helix domain-containing protein [Hominifimenecus sp. rT4P-3]|uniref:helix-turn-helix domain-containing protein n=1 Tax=Hominifimenecus sp. rT4P-3 TaxID=3242979 RepID=UPI003DA6CDE2